MNKNTQNHIAITQEAREILSHEGRLFLHIDGSLKEFIPSGEAFVFDPVSGAISLTVGASVEQPKIYVTCALSESEARARAMLKAVREPLQPATPPVEC